MHRKRYIRSENICKLKGKSRQRLYRIKTEKYVLEKHSGTALCSNTDVCGAIARLGTSQLQVETSETLNAIIFPFSKANY